MRKISLYALLIVMVFSLSGCGDKESKKKDDSSQIVSTDNKSDDSKEDKKTDSDKEDVEEKSSNGFSTNFHLGNIQWGEEKDLSQIPIYGPNVTMPITKEDMEVFAPYQVLASSSPLEENGIYLTYDELYEVTKDWTGISYNNIYTKQYDDAELEDPNPEFDTGNLMINEHKQGKCATLGEAFDKGNWMIESVTESSSGRALYSAFGLSEDITGDVAYQWVIDNLGTPSYIIFKTEDLEQAKAGDTSHYLGYEFVYEREDYVLSVYLCEFWNDGDFMYNEVMSVKYYNPLSWFNRMAYEENLEQEKGEDFYTTYYVAIPERTHNTIQP